jgi:hypothetical protein
MVHYSKFKKKLERVDLEIVNSEISTTYFDDLLFIA